MYVWSCHCGSGGRGWYCGRDLKISHVTLVFSGHDARNIFSPCVLKRDKFYDFMFVSSQPSPFLKGVCSTRKGGGGWGGANLSDSFLYPFK